MNSKSKAIASGIGGSGVVVIVLRNVDEVKLVLRLDDAANVTRVLSNADKADNAVRLIDVSKKAVVEAKVAQETEAASESYTIKKVWDTVNHTKAVVEFAGQSLQVAVDCQESTVVQGTIGITSEQHRQFVQDVCGQPPGGISIFAKLTLALGFCLLILGMISKKRSNPRTL